MFIAHHQFSVRENIFIANDGTAAAAAARIKTEEVLFSGILNTKQNN